MDRVLRNSLITGGTLLLTIIISVTAFAFRPGKSVYLVLFFPDATTGEHRGERREIPTQPNRESEIEYVLRELILGPTVLQLSRALPRDTRIESVIYRNDVVYLNFDPELLFQEGEGAPRLDESLDIVRKTIEFNYPMVDEIRFFVAGSET